MFALYFLPFSTAFWRRSFCFLSTRHLHFRENAKMKHDMTGLLFMDIYEISLSNNGLLSVVCVKMVGSTNAISPATYYFNTCSNKAVVADHFRFTLYLLSHNFNIFIFFFYLFTARFTVSSLGLPDLTGPRIPKKNFYTFF